MSKKSPRPIIASEELTYASPQILERRHRILREARKLIAEHGLEGFSVRELCRRSNVAQRTLYNAFGSKENVLATAIRTYQAAFSERLPSKEPDTLPALLRLILAIAVRNLQIQNYTRAVIGIYFSPSVDPRVRNAIHRLGMPLPWLARVAQEKMLKPGVDPEDLASMVASIQYAVLSQWAVGAIDDSLLPRKMIEGVLLLTASATSGSAHAEIEAYLEDLRGPRRRFRTLLRNAERGVAQALRSRGARSG